MIFAARVRNDVRRCLASAIVAAILLSGYIGILTLLHGSTTWTDLHATSSHIVVGYFGAAVVAGVIVGVLWPLTQWRIGAVAIGALGGTLIYGAVAVAAQNGLDGLRLAPVPGMLVGGGLGLHFWDEAHPELRGSSTRRLTILVGALAALVIFVMMRIARHL